MSSPENRAVRAIINQCRGRDWRGDQGGCAGRLAQVILDDPTILDRPRELARAVPDVFALTNGVEAIDVVDQLQLIRGELLELARHHQVLARPPLIQMDQIDTFARVAEIPATQVQALCPLDLLEDDVEQIIANVIGEPFRQLDWGGELDDLFSQSVQLGGRAVRTSFLLKGRGKKAVMKMKDLGRNGDQVTRMMKQPAELFVVQHVNRIDGSVYSHLQDAVVARRAEGHDVVGSVWDGVTIARLGVAHGYLDPKTGALIPNALRKL